MTRFVAVLEEWDDMVADTFEPHTSDFLDPND